jgi:hypothetical protein
MSGGEIRLAETREPERVLIHSANEGSMLHCVLEVGKSFGDPSQLDEGQTKVGFDDGHGDVEAVRLTHAQRALERHHGVGEMPTPQVRGADPQRGHGETGGMIAGAGDPYGGDPVIERTGKVALLCERQAQELARNHGRERRQVEPLVGEITGETREDPFEMRHRAPVVAHRMIDLTEDEVDFDAQWKVVEILGT